MALCISENLRLRTLENINLYDNGIDSQKCHFISISKKEDDFSRQRFLLYFSGTPTPAFNIEAEPIVSRIEFLELKLNDFKCIL